MTNAQAKFEPATKELLQKFKTNLLDNSFNSLGTLVTYKGSGTNSYIRHVLQNRSDFNVSTDKVFIAFDLRNADVDTNTLFAKALTSIPQLNEAILSVAAKKLIDEILKQDHISKNEFLALIHFIKQDEKKTAVFIVTGLFKLTQGNFKGKDQLVELLQQDSQFSGIFIQDFEVTQATQAHLQPIWDYMLSNRVNGKDFYFDTEQIHASAQFYNVVLTDDELTFLDTFCIGEPAIYKKIVLNIERYRKDKLFLLTKPDEIIKCLDEEWVNAKFNKLLLTLSAETADLIQTNTKIDEKIPNYLLLSGLGRLENNSFHFTNKLFDYFVRHSDKNPGHHDIKFTGYEEILFKVLKNNLGEIVPKEHLAKEVWGEDWELQYSDGALDKLVSNTRAKLKGQNYEIRSIKKRGVVLTTKD